MMVGVSPSPSMVAAHSMPSPLPGQPTSPGSTTARSRFRCPAGQAPRSFATASGCASCTRSTQSQAGPASSSTSPGRSPNPHFRWRSPPISHSSTCARSPMKCCRESRPRFDSPARHLKPRIIATGATRPSRPTAPPSAFRSPSPLSPATSSINRSRSASRPRRPLRPRSSSCQGNPIGNGPSRSPCLSTCFARLSLGSGSR